MLAERTALILASIVGEYVDSALPVGSGTVVRKYHLPISAATVRTEMSRLEQEGYVTHPHTSAGRIPSDKGYRYYVESLMEEEVLPGTLQRQISRRFAPRKATAPIIDSLEAWVRLAAAVLAESVQNAAVATAPRVPRCRLQHVEAVSLDEDRALLIVVLHGARIRQRAFNFPDPVDQEQLTALAHRLTELLRGMTASQIESAGVSLSAMEKLVAGLAAEMMEAEEEAQYGEAYLDGMANIFSQPEFSHMDSVLEMLATLQGENITRIIPFETIPSDGITVIIGAENPEEGMRRCSIILTRYGVPGSATGALAVVGPTRMRYSRVIPTVKYLSSLMGEQVAQLC